MDTLYRDYLVPLSNYVTFNCPPGPAQIPLSRVIDFCKALTLPFCLFLMAQSNNWSYSAYLIMALHGSYGLLWILKGVILPDAYWENRAKYGSLLITFVVLCGYWSSAYIIITTHVKTSPLRMFFAIMIYVFGVVLMIASDTQKYFVLQEKAAFHQPKEQRLIQNGWFTSCRNTNYLGEMMLYGSFALLSESVFPWCITGTVWLSIFCSRWYEKEQSFGRKIGGLDYIERSSIILPVPLPFLPIPSLFSAPKAKEGVKMKKNAFQETEEQGDSTPGSRTRAASNGGSKTRRRGR